MQTYTSHACTRARTTRACPVECSCHSRRVTTAAAAAAATAAAAKTETGAASAAATVSEVAATLVDDQVGEVPVQDGASLLVDVENVCTGRAHGRAARRQVRVVTQDGEARQEGTHARPRCNRTRQERQQQNQGRNVSNRIRQER